MLKRVQHDEIGQIGKKLANRERRCSTKKGRFLCGSGPFLCSHMKASGALFTRFGGALCFEPGCGLGFLRGFGGSLG
jgi:hypothetical protein